MKHIEFNELLDKIIKRTTFTLASKSAEYSTDDDKLHNFKRAGDMKHETPEKALVGMWVKHIISILDIVDDIEKENQKIGLIFRYNPKHDLDIKIVEEKVGDAINYLILLEALIKERYKK